VIVLFAENRGLELEIIPNSNYRSNPGPPEELRYRHCTHFLTTPTFAASRLNFQYT